MLQKEWRLFSRLAKFLRSKPGSYTLIIGMFLSLLVVALAASSFAIEIVNDTRAYSTGEGRYSKAQKLAVLDLYRYAHTAHVSDYQAFLGHIAIPRGDKAAREALTASPADRDAAEKGFLEGQNHPRDVGGLVRLFRWFSWWRPFAEATADWRAADGMVDQLVLEARRLHETTLRTPRDQAARMAALRRIEALDRELTDRENTFSTHMGDAARLATALVVWGLGLTTILLWAVGIGFAARLIGKQSALDRQLVLSEHRFRDFAEVASDWYWEIDVDGKVTYVSPRFAESTNMAPTAVVGRSAIGFIHDTARDPQERDACLAAIAARQSFRGVCLSFPVGNTPRYCAISAKPYFHLNGTFRGYRGVGTDITAQVNDAQALRTAKDRAEGANRAKSEFLANMSHELRTPLNAILGFSDIIAQRLFGDGEIERYAEYAGDIHGSGAHLLAIINDILDLSKIEAGRATLEESEISLDAILRDVATLLGDSGDRKGVVYRNVPPSEHLNLFVDTRRLVQILVNIASNAIKFTPAGGKVTLSCVSEVGGGLAFIVHDTGIGIAPEEIELVLSPFGQVESAFQRQHHGTGLGLPLAKLLSEMHGGTLVIDSTPMVGTTVTVHLPATRVRAASLREVA